MIKNQQRSSRTTHICLSVYCNANFSQKYIKIIIHSQEQSIFALFLSCCYLPVMVEKITLPI